MDPLRPPLRLDAVAARVVAWHNRHPLARRIGSAQVHAVGYVALPFGVADGVPLPAPQLQSQADLAVPDGAWPAFDEDFIAPLRPAQVASWARRNGVMLAQPPDGGLLREVRSQALPADTRALAVYALTAAIEADGLRTRVLIGAGDDAAVLGRRLPSTLRAGVAAGALVAVAGAALLWALGPGRASTAPSLAGAPAPPASAASVPLLAAVAPPASAASAPVVAAAAPALPASAPIDVEPTLGRVELPPLNLPRKDRAPRRAAASASAAPAAPGAAAAAASAPARSVAARHAETPAYAVASRVLRTRAEAEQVRDAMRGLLARNGDARAASVTVDIWAEGDDWRVVGWPFEQRSQAEQARALLVARGLRVAVVAF